MSNTSTSAPAPLPSRESVVEVLKQIVLNDLNVALPTRDIDENMALVEEGLGLDSIVLVEMIGYIEDRLGFEFDEDDLSMRSFENLSVLAEVIVARMKSRA